MKKRYSESFYAQELLATWLFTVAFMGTALAFIFWFTWREIFGYVPTFMGYSRAWTDMVACAPYAVIASLFLSWSAVRHDEISCGGRYIISICDVFQEDVRLGLLEIFAAADIAASIYFSFAVGLAAILALFVCVCLVRFIGKLARTIIDLLD